MSNGEPSSPDTPAAGERPEELPPVSPPSSGYIIQLFLIPALIVAAIVAVWALFGKLADSGSDWRQMVADLGSGNEHRRGRAAHGLSQMLRNEEIAPPTDRPPLSRQPEVIDAIMELLSESLQSPSEDPEHIRHQAFLARTAGWLDAEDRTLPVLAMAMQPSSDADVRQSALMAVALIAGRQLEEQTGYTAEERGPESRSLPDPLDEPTIDNAEVWEQLKRAAQDSEPVVRHLAAFAIGNVGGPAAVEELKILLNDGDPKTRANAAFGLIRNGSPAGIPVILELMDSATQPWTPDTSAAATPEEQADARVFHEIEEPKIVEYGIRALSEAWGTLDAESRERARSILEQIASDYHSPPVRSQAGILLKQIGPEASSE